MMSKARSLFFALLILSMLGLPVCVDAVGPSGDSARVSEASVYAMRGGHAVVAFADEPGSIEVQGTLYDEATGQPLGKASIELVRFDTGEFADLDMVTLDQVTALPYSAKSVITEQTAGRGDFALSDLSPGAYSLQIAWDEVPAGSNVVRWDLKWVKTPAAADGKN